MDFPGFMVKVYFDFSRTWLATWPAPTPHNRICRFIRYIARRPQDEFGKEFTKPSRGPSDRCDGSVVRQEMRKISYPCRTHISVLFC
jgi:hypothetical protein